MGNEIPSWPHEWLNPSQTRPLCSCGWHGPQRGSSVTAGTEWMMHAHASDQAIAVLRLAYDAVKALPSACHSHSGLNCENDWFDGQCSLIDGHAVLAAIAATQEMI